MKFNSEYRSSASVDRDTRYKSFNMLPSTDHIAEAVDVVEAYTNELNLYPVDLEQLKNIVEEQLKIKVYVEYIDVGDYRGWCIPGNSPREFDIRIDDKPRDDPEFRYTFAHELAHLFVSYKLHEDKPPTRLNNWAYSVKTYFNNPEERICDQYAIFFLCPVPEMDKLLKTFQEYPQLRLFEESNIDEIVIATSDYFNVPRHLMGAYLNRYNQSHVSPLDWFRS